MKLGILLPSFAATPERSFAAAEQAEAAGIHGVFAYCHLWPLGRPGRPAISPYPLLGAVAGTTTRVTIGTLVARVGLESDGALLGELLGLEALAPGRFIAGVGTGDSLSANENRAYGVAFAPTRERREQLARIAGSLVADGVETWIGGGSQRTNDIARSLSTTINLWGAPVADVARVAGDGPVSWGGTLLAEDSDAVDQLRELRDAGATWAVFTFPLSVARLVEVAERAGISLGA